MLLLYVKFTASIFLGFELVVSLVVVFLSWLIRSGFLLQPNISVFIRKIKGRSAHSIRAKSAAFITGTTVLVLVAFFMGNKRMTLLLAQYPQMTSTEKFTGMANILASSGNALLLFQKQEKEIRYIYSSPEFTTSVESINSGFPQIASKK